MIDVLNDPNVELHDAENVMAEFDQQLNDRGL
jgi:hypothetical protein